MSQPPYGQPQPPAPDDPQQPGPAYPGQPDPSGQGAYPGQPAAYPGRPGTYPGEQAGYPGQPTGPGQYGQGPGYGAQPPAQQGSSGLAITGFVLALLGLVLCLIPVVNIFGGILAFAGLVLGIVGLVKASKGAPGKGLSIAAIIIAVVAGIGVIVSNAIFISAVDSAVNDVATESVEEVAPEAPADEDAAVDEAPADPAPEDVPALALAFGETATFEDGLAVAASVPAAYTPSEWAAGAEGFTQFVRIDITLTNGTDEAFDPTLTYTTLSSAGVEGSQIFDSQNGLEGGPTTSLLPGQSVTFPVAFGVNDPADLTLEVSPGAFEYDSVIFSTAP
ncbi:hypothetical protein [Oerskovia enterophila]|uniref:Telomeric repeat-binding factor 2 n=1 Tax=Oerskovia enterophila TaxID=43678 RepID=A0A165S2K4_9CELL|nr:hypothetical protein [Oerskovia enterophila]KZM35463.1 hypothetical protein OJAG_18940 [Oerskovia enterophila]